MPIYSYQALKKGKEVVKGEVTASNLKDARDVIRKMGLVPTKIIEYTEGKINKSEQIKPLSLNEKIDFISTLQILLSSGIPAVESLMFMEQEAARKKIRETSRILKTQIMAGSTFADTMARFPKVFGYIFIGLVKAGEESGELEKTLGRIKDLLTKQANIKAKVIGTMMYPTFVICLAFVISIVMLTFVFPAFKEMFEMQEKTLPLITTLMINAGDYLKTYWYTIPIFIIFLGVFIYMIFNWEPAKRVFDKFVLKIPLISNLVMYSNYSNFMSVFSVSYDAGIPIVDCLHLAVTTLTNSVLRNKISSAIIKVQQGLQVSQALRSTKIMPKMLLFMVATGEQSGRLGDMLEKAVNFLDKTLDGIIDTITKMIEPVMLIVIGSIVLVMALALYLPLFQSYMT
ncbi:type II secretion system F family protein [bacterium]|nr:type II secretion system F family protein [bacterium]MBR1776525.1 type II secretion system F family protein [bacterium]